MTTLDAAIRAKLDGFQDHACQAGAWCYVTGFNDLREVLLYVLDYHAPGYPNGEVAYEWTNEPLFDKDGVPRGSYQVKGDPVAAYWCQACEDIAPCPVVTGIAGKLGVQVATDG